MGIVNVTPDSFSDGGKYFRPEEAIRRARNIVAEGAAFVDFGAESTRPGATPIGWEEEWARLEPVLRGFGGGTRVSVDTYHPETARHAIRLGVSVVNCVYAEPIPEMIALMREFGQVELVMPAVCIDLVAGEPELMRRVYLDPKAPAAVTERMLPPPPAAFPFRPVPELAKKGRVLVGASRKRIVKKLTGEKVTGKNLGGNLGIAVWCAMHGAAVVRVHDVRETCQAIKVVETIGPGAVRPPGPGRLDA